MELSTAKATFSTKLDNSILLNCSLLLITFAPEGSLEQVPERLVVDGVVELDFGALDDGSQLLGAAIGGGFFQIGITALHIGAEDLGDPVGGSEVGDCLVDVVGQVAAAGAKAVLSEISPSMPVLKIEYIDR